MGFFDKHSEEQDLQLIEKQKLLLETARLTRERGQRVKAFLDSQVYRDIQSIIEKLKDDASNEARSYKSSEYLYGIDILNKFEKILREVSSIV